ncbi:MAG: 16S rRNA (uracil(1498)-N(3))-methyltransferase [Verrucomicrobia bacterium]|nr:16S rRNA (uracil(1498)-N(3))-methyltransferase [Verrucomicrobiota bacterium]
MPHERFFVDQPLNLNESVSLLDTEFHHLCHVMRARIGDHVELVNGKNQLAEATLSSIAKHHADLKISNVIDANTRKPQLILAQAIPRFNRLEYILEKATELDATEFWLFPGHFSEKDAFSENQLKRMTQLTVSAMKQCGRLDLPSISFKPPLLKWKPIEGRLLFGDTSPDAPSLARLDLSNEAPCTVFFIGPEKGFDPKETLFLKENLRAQGVRLHRNILRVDTAPLAALSILSEMLHQE